MWTRWNRDETGVALIFALFAVLILSGVAVVVANTAQSQQRASGFARDYESAVHAAEAGVDTVIASVNNLSDFTTVDPTGGSDHVYTLPDTATMEEQAAWARGIADAGRCEFVRSGFGETCGIRPVDSVTSEPLDVIYGVGYVPSRANPSRVRVIRVAYDRGFFSTNKAILTQGDLTISGSADILGTAGHVHTNSDLDISGSAATVSGDVTYSGDLIGDTTGKATEADAEFVPEIRAREVYEQRASSNSTVWFDLCPDGTVRAPSSTNEPCTGADLWNHTQTSVFRGWRYNKTSDTTATWSVQGNTGWGDGIYYIYHGNASISGNPGTASDPADVSIILERTVNCGGADPWTTPDDNGSRSGNFEMTGNSVWHPYLDDALVIAEGDIYISGTPQQNLKGVMATAQQIKVIGNPSMEGSLIAADECDIAGSPVHENDISGSMDLTYNGNAVLPLGGIVRVTDWNEIG